MVNFRYMYIINYIPFSLLSTILDILNNKTITKLSLIKRLRKLLISYSLLFTH